MTYRMPVIDTRTSVRLPVLILWTVTYCTCLAAVLSSHCNNTVVVPGKNSTSHQISVTRKNIVVSLETEFLHHTQNDDNVWSLQFVVSSERMSGSPLMHLDIHHEKISRISILCRTESEMSKWIPTNSTDLHFKFQVGPYWVKLFQVTNDQEELVESHICPTTLPHFPHWTIGVQCGTLHSNDSRCGNITQPSCHQDCKKTVVIPGNKDERHELVATQTNQKVVEAEFIHHIPRNGINMGLALHVFSNQTLLPVGQVYIRYDINESGIIKCRNLTKEFQWTLKKATGHHLKLQISSKQLKILEIIQGQETYIDAQFCEKTLLDFPNLRAFVRCMESDRCGSIIQPCHPDSDTSTIPPTSTVYPQSTPSASAVPPSVTPSPSALPPTTPSSSVMRWVIAVVVLGISCIIGFMVIYYFKKSGRFNGRYRPTGSYPLDSISEPNPTYMLE